MGFDISGLDATSEKGEYFRNNVWWWRPLANYILENMPELDSSGWGFNDGHEVSAENALKIADTLDELLSSGETAKYSREYARSLKKLPLETCEICKGKGKRNDDIVKGECNGCKGKGQRESFATNYPFSVENVREFAKFCRESGGFAIY